MNPYRVTGEPSEVTVIEPEEPTKYLLLVRELVQLLKGPEPVRPTSSFEGLIELGTYWQRFFNELDSLKSGGDMEREVWIEGRRYFLLGNGERLLLQGENGKLRLAVREGNDIRFIGPEPGVNVAITHAPWTAEEVDSLNGWQRCGFVHEFTGDRGETLIATLSGWVSEVGGPIIQTWAWVHMANGGWKRHPLYKGEEYTSPRFEED